MTGITDTSESCTSLGGFNLPNRTCVGTILIDNHAGSSLTVGPASPARHCCT